MNALHLNGTNMTKEQEQLDNLKAEVEENAIDKELYSVDPVWDKVSQKPTGSFAKMAEVERNLKRKK